MKGLQSHKNLLGDAFVSYLQGTAFYPRKGSFFVPRVGMDRIVKPYEPACRCLGELPAQPDGFLSADGLLLRAASRD